MAALGTKPGGLSRGELLDATGRPDGGRFGKYLEELEACGFVRHYRAPGRKVKDAVYQLADNFTLFHLRFVAGDGVPGAKQWTDRLETPEYHSWAGSAFERVCLLHVGEIKRALEIGGVRTAEYAWRGTAPDGKPAQIDLLVDRNDGIADLCEMKYTNEPYALSEDEWNKICRRRGAVRSALPSKAVHVVLVTNLPAVRNAWSKEIAAFVTGDDLYRER